MCYKKRTDDELSTQKFASQILPPYVRLSPKVSAVLPLLYLRGLSTGDFREALPVLLGDRDLKEADDRFKPSRGSSVDAGSSMWMAR